MSRAKRERSHGVLDGMRSAHSPKCNVLGDIWNSPTRRQIAQDERLQDHLWKALNQGPERARGHYSGSKSAHVLTSRSFGVTRLWRTFLKLGWF